MDLREIDLKKLRLSQRTWIIIGAALVVVAAGALTWRYITHPPRPWLVRWKLDRYLKHESHASSFKVDFPFPSKSEMSGPKVKPGESAPKVGARTGKSFDALRDEYLSQKTAAVALERIVVRSENELKDANTRLDALTKQLASADANASNVESNITVARERITTSQKSPSRRPELRVKEESIAPIEDDLWEFQRMFAQEAAASENSGSAALVKARTQFTDEAEKKMASAPSYDAMYRTIGEELYVAKNLLDSGNPEHRRQGVTVAMAASRQAMRYTENGAVAARICEGYVLPNLDLANDTNPRSLFNEDNLLRQCSDIFERNYEYNNVVRTYQIYLAGVKNAQRADWARSRIGMAYEQAGDPKHALEAFQQIHDTNSYRQIFRFQVPRLQKQLKG